MLVHVEPASGDCSQMVHRWLTPLKSAAGMLSYEDSQLVPLAAIASRKTLKSSLNISDIGTIKPQRPSVALSRIVRRKKLP
jgi:hypothetical protein